jgi:hypothetical protein
VCLTDLTGVEPLSESCSVSSAGTGLTGGAHWPDRCGSVDSGFVFPLRFSGRKVVCWFLGRVALVATWAWPT